MLVAVPVWEQVKPRAAVAEPAETLPRLVPPTTEGDGEPAPPATTAAARGESGRVARVVDGDTIVLDTGTTVRLVQIDAPEVRGAECYADEATAALEALIPAGTRVGVATDPALDQVDRYGRQLAYVFAGDVNVNLRLVRDGAASVWFYRGARGAYADELLAAAEQARDSERGLWGACDAVLDPLAAVSTAPRGEPGREGAAAAAADAAAEGCHPAYDPCLPIVRDLNCPAVRALGKAPVTVKVRGVDPYHLDGDRDGIGCE
jgi:micrococcal nuclease